MGSDRDVTVVPVKWVVTLMTGPGPVRFLLEHVVIVGLGTLQSRWAIARDIYSGKLAPMLFDSQEEADRTAVLEQLLEPERKVVVVRWVTAT